MSAAESVWALVSSLPSGERERQLIMPLQAFIDDSQNDGAVLVLAGYIAHSERWAEFSTQWKALLQGPPVWHEFKMARLKRKMDLCPDVYGRVLDHYEIILRHVTVDICVAVPLKALYKVADDYNLPKRERNAYFMAWNLMVSTYIGYANEIGINAPIEFVFDDQSEKTRVILAWDSYSNFKLRHRRLIESAPIFRKSSRTMPLQAADFLAHWKREEYMTRGTVHDLRPIRPWMREDSDIRHLYAQVSEEKLRAIFRAQLDSKKYDHRSAFEMKSYGIGCCGWA